MLYIVVTLVTLMIVFAMMAVGLILRGKPIKGTCASLSNIGMKEDCEICGGDANKCESTQNAASRSTVGGISSGDKSTTPSLFRNAVVRRDSDDLP